ncbi:MAG TPA: hypothetical protein VFV50_03520 [Bdellovibrionales bacterium]|nr:hypothetical protein [Bdellovibrionales bacterium]
MTHSKLSKWLLTALTGLTIVTPSITYARGSGGANGGGGNAVVCFKTPGTAAIVRRQGKVIKNSNVADIASVVLLDVFQARLKSGYDAIATPLVAADPAKTAIANADRIIARIEKASPGLASIFTYWKDRFALNVSFEPDGLGKVDDTYHKSLTGEFENCVVATVAVQTHINNLSTLQIDPRLFDKMDRLNQAALYLHEFALAQFLSFDSSYERVEDEVRLKKTVTPAVRQLIKAVLLRDLNVSELLYVASSLEVGVDQKNARLYKTIEPIIHDLTLALLTEAETIWNKYKGEISPPDLGYMTGTVHSAHMFALSTYQSCMAKPVSCSPATLAQYEREIRHYGALLAKIEPEFKGAVAVQVRKILATVPGRLKSIPGLPAKQLEELQVLFDSTIGPDFANAKFSLRTDAAVVVMPRSHYAHVVYGKAELKPTNVTWAVDGRIWDYLRFLADSLKEDNTALMLDYVLKM